VSDTYPILIHVSNLNSFWNIFTDTSHNNFDTFFYQLQTQLSSGYSSFFICLGVLLTKNTKLFVLWDTFIVEIYSDICGVEEIM
jgi:hypothetical protein